MKKFYCFIMMAAMTLSAIAATPALRSGFIGKKAAPAAAQTVKMVKKQSALSRRLPAAAAEAPVTDATIDGDYTITIDDCYFEDSYGELTFDATISTVTTTTSGNQIKISCPDWFIDDVLATYYPDRQVVNFESYEVGEMEDDGTVYYVRFEPFIYDWDEEEIKEQSYVVGFDPTAGTLSFPSESGFSWPAYTTDAYEVMDGYFDVFDVKGMTAVPAEPADPNEGWTSMGNATFVDGWVVPAFKAPGNTQTYAYEVELQQNDANPNVYRLVDPYHGNFPFAADNESTRTGYIQFDVTDPDHVVFEAVNAGFANAELELSQLYCLNTLGVFVGYFNASPAEVVASFGDEIPYTTFKNGVVSLTSITVTGDDGEETMYDACFGDQSDPYAGYIWEGAEMNASITFPGVDGIATVETDSAEGPAVFYDLQGRRIAAPRAGTVVLSRRGSVTAKLRL